MKPLVIAVLPLEPSWPDAPRSHIAATDSDVALCGLDVRGGVRVTHEPGQDFGAHRHDCQTCALMRQPKAGP